MSFSVLLVMVSFLSRSGQRIADRSPAPSVRRLALEEWHTITAQGRARYPAYKTPGCCRIDMTLARPALGEHDAISIRSPVDILWKTCERNGKRTANVPVSFDVLLAGICDSHQIDRNQSPAPPQSTLRNGDGRSLSVERPFSLEQGVLQVPNITEALPRRRTSPALGVKTFVKAVAYEHRGNDGPQHSEALFCFSSQDAHERPAINVTLGGLSILSISAIHYFNSSRIVEI
jgi:hypothetical protein